MNVEVWRGTEKALLRGTPDPLPGKRDHDGLKPKEAGVNQRKGEKHAELTLLQAGKQHKQRRSKKENAGSATANSSASLQ